ncbi:hypothetical protein ACC699_38730, partial [Rhizobium ruizarguesonis]
MNPDFGIPNSLMIEACSRSVIVPRLFGVSDIEEKTNIIKDLSIEERARAPARIGHPVRLRTTSSLF